MVLVVPWDWERELAERSYLAPSSASTNLSWSMQLSMLPGFIVYRELPRKFPSKSMFQLWLYETMVTNKRVKLYFNDSFERYTSARKIHVQKCSRPVRMYVDEFHTCIPKHPAVLPTQKYNILVWWEGVWDKLKSTYERTWRSIVTRVKKVFG